MAHPAIRRLNHDIQRLHQAKDRRHDVAKELKKDERALKTDRRQLEHHRDAFEGHHKELKKDRTTLGKLTDSAKEQLQPLEARKAELEAQLAASVDPLTGQPDPLLQGALTQVNERLANVHDRFDPQIAGKRDEVQRGVAAIARDRTGIASEKKEIAGDKREVKHDEKALKTAKARVSDRLHTARKHLRPAEYHMGLKATNRARKELGLKAVDHVIRPMNLNTVQGCAQFLLKSKNVSFWSGLSTGSDRKNLERLARGEKAFVPATGGHVTPKLSMMQALVDMAKHGPIQINALTGGVHSSNSNHYRGTAVDLQLGVGSASQIAAIANRHGGFRNSEADHIHLDF